MNNKKILITYSIISTFIVVFLIAMGYIDFMHYIALTLSLIFGLIGYAIAYQSYLESKPIYFWLIHALSYMIFRFLGFFMIFYVGFHAQHPLQATNAATMSLNANRVEHIGFSDNKEYQGEKHIFIFYKHGCRVCQRTQSEIYDFLNKNYPKDKRITYVNIETEQGQKLADKFGLKHSYYIVLKDENEKFEVLDRSQDNFLDKDKISTFLAN